MRAPGTAYANRPLASLAASDLAEIEVHLTSVDLVRGSVLSDVDDVIEYIYFPDDGLVSFVAVTDEGASVEVAAIGKEGVVGGMDALGDGRSNTRCIVQIPGSGHRMPVEDYLKVHERNAAVRRMSALYGQGLLSQTLRSVACMAFHTVEQRFCRWLLTARDQIGRDTLELTQEFLAEMLGCQRTTVTVIAGSMQAAGLIRYQRGRIEILDPTGLEEGSCDCYWQTKMTFAKLFPAVSDQA